VTNKLTIRIKWCTKALNLLQDCQFLSLSSVFGSLSSAKQTWCDDRF